MVMTKRNRFLATEFITKIHKNIKNLQIDVIFVRRRKVC